MSKGKKVAIWIFGVLVCLGVVAGIFVPRRHSRPVVLRGAVTVWDPDTRKQLHIADAQITEANGFAGGPATSDPMGLFTLKLQTPIRRGHPIALLIRHPSYQPLQLQDVASDKLYVVRLKPVATQREELPASEMIAVDNVRVRYTSKAVRVINVGSAVKAFQVENAGNIACEGKPPCSPDGKWKATIGSASLDAGPGNEFRNARASCIAGPCPFAKIEHDGFTEGGQKINVFVRNWSDTVTFLMEAEVVRSMVGPIDHESYPVIFGRELNFTLPASAEGVNIEADINGETIVFPLGPALFLSWAECGARLNKDPTKVYRCELKPKYRFR